jgi:hypothetical protein
LDSARSSSVAQRSCWRANEQPLSLLRRGGFEAALGPGGIVQAWPAEPPGARP